MSLPGRLALASRRGLTLANLFERLAAAHDRRTFVEEPARSRTLTFEQAAALVARWSAALAPSLAPGDRVVVAVPNGADHLLLTAAVARAGGIAVPVNPLVRPEELDHVVADAKAAVVLHDTAALDAAPGSASAAASPAPASVAALFYTSGTTGVPKGVELTHVGLLGASPVLALRAPLREQAVVALPIAHIMGFSALVGLACAGVPVVVHERFHPVEVLDAIESRRATVFVGVPAMYRLLEAAGAAERDLTSVRLWLCGADVMPPDLARRFQGYGSAASLPLVGSVGEAFFAEGYGMAELSGAVIGRLDLPGVGRFLGDALGVALPGYRLRVVRDDGRDARIGETGELWVKGRGTSPGYWGVGGATEEGGWLRTGDLVRKGAFGTVGFAGRAKEVVKHGGYSVYVEEIEAVLRTHPDVVDAAALGRPDPALGEVPVAAVVLREGARATPDDLVAFGREHLADYKWPRQVVVLDELPRTGSHKVQRRLLTPHFTPSF